MGQERGLFEEGADALEVLAAGRMKPTEQTDAMETGGQDVLEEAAEEFERFQIEVTPLASLALTVRPADAAVGQEMEGAVGGGGLEDVTAEIAQSIFARTHRLEIDDPTLLPGFGGECFPGGKVLFLEGSGEEGAEVLSQGSFGEEELVAGGDPGALVGAEAAAGQQIMDVGMVDEGAGPGVEKTEQAQSGTQAFGVAAQILESLGAGGEEERVTQLGMGTDPAAQGIREGKGDQEIRDGQEELGLMSQPGLGVGLTALGAMAIVAGMVGVVVGVTVGAGEERASQSRGAAVEDGLQNLPLAGGHGLAETLQVGWSVLDQELMETQSAKPARLWGWRASRHGPGGLEVGHEGIQALLMLGFGEAG
jgi:hypothetical protein